MHFLCVAAILSVSWFVWSFISFIGRIWTWCLYRRGGIKYLDFQSSHSIIFQYPIRCSFAANSRQLIEIPCSQFRWSAALAKRPLIDVHWVEQFSSRYRQAPNGWFVRSPDLFTINGSTMNVNMSTNSVARVHWGLFVCSPVRPGDHVCLSRPKPWAFSRLVGH